MKITGIVVVLLLLAALLAGCATSSKVDLDDWGTPQKSEWEGGPWQDYSP